MKNPGKALIEHYGGIRPAAEAFGVTYECMRRWGVNGIPLEACVRVEMLSGGAIQAETVLEYWRKKTKRRNKKVG